MHKSILLIIFLLFAVLVLGGCGQKSSNSSEIKIASLMVSPEAATVYIGESQKFSIKGAGFVSSAIDEHSISWEVIGNIGTIDSSGVFIASREGFGTVEASIGGLLGSAEVLVVCYLGRTVTGKVIDMVSERAIPGAVVCADGKNTVTDSTGYYSLKNISASCDAITFQCSGYSPVSVFTTKEALNVELGLIPDIYNGSMGYSSIGSNSTIEGSLRGTNGAPISERFNVELRHPYYYSSAFLSDGSFSISCYLDPDKFPLKAFLSGATSRESFIKEIQLQNVGNIDVGTIETSLGVATLSGKSLDSFASGWSDIVWGITDGQKRWYFPNYYGVINNPSYTLYLPPTPSGYKYFLLSTCSLGNNSNAYVSQSSENFTVSSGETKTINFSLPSLITGISPENGGIVKTSNPTISWDAHSPKDNLYIVFLFQGGDSRFIQWVGVTDKTSIRYPSFPASSGLENANIKPNAGYVLQIYGYYIPNFNLHSNSLKVANIVNSKSFEINSATGDAGQLHADTISELYLATELTMSGRINFTTTSSLED